MLTVADLINIQYIPEISDISLALLVDYYEQYLCKYIFMFCLSDGQKVKIHQTYFDREPDEVGYNNWLSQLNSGTSRKFVVNNGFSNSLEFRNLVASFGL